MKSAILCLVAACLANPLGRRGYAVKEAHPAPRSWIKLQPAHHDAVLNLQIALKQSNMQELERQLYLVSDPDSPSYGQHLGAADVHDLIKPDPSSVDAVVEWLQEHGLHTYRFSPARDWIYLDAPVSAVNRMLDSEYYDYANEQLGYIATRLESYRLPMHLHSHIDTIQPTTYFSGIKQRGVNVVPFTAEQLAQLQQPPQLEAMAATDSNPFYPQFYCNSTVSVECIRELYETANYTANPKNGNKLGITGYLGEVANREDLQIFLKAQRPEAVGTTFTEVLVNGGVNPQDSEAFNSSGTSEAGLDIQFGSGLAYPTPVTFWSTGGSPPSTLVPDTSEPYLDWLNFVLAQSDDDIPQVISTSYGDDEQSVPLAYATRVCQQFAQLGARGVTLFFASGDDGVGSGDDDACLQNDNSTVSFIPSFPASCPWVTTVGSTNNIPNEVATTRFPSGSGFSNYFGRPSYQDSAVDGYLQNINQTLLGSYKSANLFNSSGRAYPDISCLGDRFAVYVPSLYYPRDQNTSAWGLIGGTSAATPACAAVFSQVNDYLIEKGNKPLGFMNPLLYSKLYPAFHDITVGTSEGCNTTGFPTAEGWDASTGFGTPRFTEILALL